MPFKVFKSSAGSGKTFTLVKEYLVLCLASNSPESYRHILAITFTNKAAEEMKTRVLEYLSALSSPEGENHKMAPMLLAELNIDFTILQGRAKNTLTHMLHHYSDISISTIDHFTHGIIRSFAQDLELSVNFEVELDSDRLVEGTVQELLSKVGSDKILTKALLNVLETQMEEEKGWSVNGALKDFSQSLFDEESRFHLQQLKHIDLAEFNNIRNDLRKKLKAIIEGVVSVGTEVMQTFEKHGITQDKMYYTSKSAFVFFKNASNGELTAPNSYVQKGVSEGKWTSKKATEREIRTIEELHPFLCKSVSRLEDLNNQNAYLSIIFNNLYRVALLDEMLRIQQQLQSDEETLHIGEFNHLISEVVMSETAPFIYERIGYKFNHLLVDEFQDTSVLQWFNLLPLVDESLAHNNLCLIVGDAKQSIYRWRGGDVRQFVAIPNEHRTPFLDEKLKQNPAMDKVMGQRAKVINNKVVVDNLDSNYRSAINVVNFNNELFSALRNSMPEDLSEMYADATQQVKAEEQGLVEIKFFHPGDNNPRSWPEYTGLTLSQIEVWVRDCIADNYKPGDIAIILRRNKDAVEVAKFLISKGINVVSNESLLISSSAEVRLLINLASWVLDEKNTINVVEAIQNLGLVRDESDLTQSRLANIGKNAHNQFQELIQTLYPKLNRNELAREGLFGLFEKLKHQVIPKCDDAYLNFFFDEVLGYANSKTTGIIGFLEYWESKRDKLSISLPEKDDAIRILTIHKSKGLEFPVVIHPFADYPTNTKGNQIWSYLETDEFKPLDRIRIPSGKALENTPFSDDNDIESELREMDMFNELYVALTRAKTRLYACGKIKKSGDPSTAIQHVFSQLAGTYPNVKEELMYQLGTRKNASKTTETQLYFELKSTGNPLWKSRIKIANPSKDKWKEKDDSDARNLGILIHDALALVNTKADIGKAITALIEDGRLSLKQSKELEKALENLLERPELKAFFNNENTIRNEADIKVSDGKWVRPDRVVFNQEKAWVLDYKTGAEKQSHQQQLQTYKKAMFDLGFKQVNGVLVYLSEERIVTV